jgi:alpha-L-fucosidase
VTLDLQQEREVCEVMLSDAPYGRTRQFDLEVQVGGQWHKLAEGTTIGEELHLEFAPVKARLFRLNIRKAADTPTLAEFQLFDLPASMK